MAETADTAPGTEPAETKTPTPWLARIHVTLKPVVLDPQGDAVLDGLHQLGFSGVAAVRQMCERLLANPVIERYTFDVAPSR